MAQELLDLGERPAFFVPPWLSFVSQVVKAQINFLVGRL